MPTVVNFSFTDSLMFRSTPTLIENFPRLRISQYPPKHVSSDHPFMKREAESLTCLCCVVKRSLLIVGCFFGLMTLFDRGRFLLHTLKVMNTLISIVRNQQSKPLFNTNSRKGRASPGNKVHLHQSFLM